MFETKWLFEGDLVAVREVRCFAGKAAAGAEEHVGETQLVVPREGVFVVQRSGIESVADATTALALPHDEAYRVSHPLSCGDRCLVLSFRRHDLAEELLWTTQPSALLPPSTILAVQLLAARAATADFESLEIEEAALAAAYAIRDALRDRPPPLCSALARRRVAEARALLAGEPGRHWTLEALAGSVHASPFHLARQFRTVSGESISRYLMHLRLSLALDRIQAGERALARLAVELGFSSHSHLTARLRKHLGATPTALRRQLSLSDPGGLRQPTDGHA